MIEDRAEKFDKILQLTEDMIPLMIQLSLTTKERKEPRKSLAIEIGFDDKKVKALQNVINTINDFVECFDEEMNSL